jgi:hypothetical protein
VVKSLPIVVCERVSPIADDNTGDMASSRIIEKGREIIRPSLPFIPLFIRQSQGIRGLFIYSRLLISIFHGFSGEILDVFVERHSSNPPSYGFALLSPHKASMNAIIFRRRTRARLHKSEGGTKIRRIEESIVKSLQRIEKETNQKG